MCNYYTSGVRPDDRFSVRIMHSLRIKNVTK